MIIVADAGPLMALAKVNGLEALFRLFPKVLTPPAVYSEVVTEGLRLGAPDAAALDLHYKNKALEVVALKEPVLSLTTRLGWGEEESIRLAIEARADWLLIDDLDARRAAPASFQSAGAETQIKGTLGIVVSAHQDAGLPIDQAISLVQALSERPDVWVSAALCRHVIEILNRTTHRSLETELPVASKASEESELSPEIIGAVHALELLGDEELWSLAREGISPEASQELETLHSKQRKAGLSLSEDATRTNLIQEYERSMLIRAQAAKLLKDRGHDVSRLLAGG